MFLLDPIYGEHQVEGILEELVNSQSVQRLKGIHQGGASFLVNPKWSVTRYEHSIGVMLLIKKLGGSLEEQIAGLLHDVSHTAFSHVVDFVFDNKEEDYHEKIVHSFLRKSEIPGILNKHGYDYEEILFKDDQWTLLEQPAPELCTDRVDYTLRDMYHYGKITLDEAHEFLSHLHVVEGKMYPTTIEAAEWFTEIYYKEVIDFFMHPLNIYGYDQLSKALKLALENCMITQDDLLGTDEEVLSMLSTSNNQQIQSILKSIHENVKVMEDSDQYDLHRKNKLRLIDPSVLCESKLVKSSSLSRKIKMMGEEASKKSSKGVYVKVISNSR
ncbi:HD domain-containing protein [Bacillus sp. CECT 9360]|uniref:HD domain-containing protein n=1 Tax=Bacillus sp. CECT 9360 TaxID=2845821 RepID=UPI001E4BB345|nr:HD domain-containing protein [Bacillus sp. CECT 9360]CAH0346096.1 hypothetical protein BCI9360_02414 [Bacillus sp. CECT 9360]